MGLSWKTLVALLMLPGALGALAAGPAGGAPQALDPLLTRPEAAQRAAELAKKGWPSVAIRHAFDTSRMDRALFGIYVRLHDSQVPPQEIAISFEVCRGEPSVINEYWGYVMGNGMPVQEVREVFATFPPNKVQRWKYFYYRTGAFGAQVPIRGADGPTVPMRPVIYSEGECMAVFVRARFNVKYVDEYFALRDKGKSPVEAVGPLDEHVKADIEREQEEQRKAAEEAKLQMEEKQKAIAEAREASQRRIKEAQEAARSKPGKVIDIDDLEAFLDSQHGGRPIEPPEDTPAQGQQEVEGDQD